MIVACSRLGTREIVDLVGLLLVVPLWNLQLASALEIKVSFLGFYNMPFIVKNLNGYLKIICDHPVLSSWLIVILPLV